jgi:hypothetical protein
MKSHHQSWLDERGFKVAGPSTWRLKKLWLREVPGPVPNRKRGATSLWIADIQNDALYPCPCSGPSPDLAVFSLFSWMCDRGTELIDLKMRNWMWDLVKKDHEVAFTRMFAAGFKDSHEGFHTPWGLNVYPVGIGPARYGMEAKWLAVYNDLPVDKTCQVPVVASCFDSNPVFGQPWYAAADVLRTLIAYNETVSTNSDATSRLRDMLHILHPPYEAPAPEPEPIPPYLTLVK